MAKIGIFETSDLIVIGALAVAGYFVYKTFGQGLNSIGNAVGGISGGIGQVADTGLAGLNSALQNIGAIGNQAYQGFVNTFTPASTPTPFVIKNVAPPATYQGAVNQIMTTGTSIYTPGSTGSQQAVNQLLTKGTIIYSPTSQSSNPNLVNQIMTKGTIFLK